MPNTILYTQHTSLMMVVINHFRQFLFKNNSFSFNIVTKFISCLKVKIILFLSLKPLKGTFVLVT
ncbi:hypothetical protein BpHYR1_046516 [Brachionus plicatilis]|uniref:Uncharacterized protein n=1 Tax=Brachionus plicatilis TaxID=10195 RepID=A0A3M7T5S0_BRAPC|nr:hypothetical protein BpHYR1_046516 [Brachionus plicatilis]